ncbi:MAG: helix-turn-helix transcriptional regulator [Lachnospiraceae bacterium]|nr:helix-turn-helix transcriptional regulator [Lachnospiraceae bacterium]
MSQEELRDRIKKIRKHSGLTQEEFSKRMGIPRNNIAGYETGRREPSNAVIALICKEFSVNEIWLRTGEGGEDNMFTKISNEDQFSISLGKLSKSENSFIHNAINTLAETEPEKLKVIEEFMRKCLGI